MEFLEYYRIVRSRIWIVMATVTIAVIVVGVYLVLPPSEYQGEGRIYVHEEASIIMTRTGNNVAPGRSEGFWYTIFQILESDSVLYPAAAAAEITDPNIIQNLEPPEGQQLSRSAVARVRAAAPEPEMARELTDAAMTRLQAAWDEVRLRQITDINGELETVLAQVEGQLAPLEEQMTRYQSSEEAGSPAEQLATLEARINTLDGQIEGGKIELELAEDRVSSLRQLAQSQGDMAAGAAYAGPLTEELRSMRQQLETLRDRLASMLKERTEEHPAVIALQDQIADLEEDIAELRSGQSDLPSPPTPIETQILDAQLAVSDARRRLEVLRAEVTNLKSQLPAARARAEEFGEFQREYQQLRAEKRGLETQFDQLEAEERRLKQTEDIEILDEAVLLPSGRTLPKAVLLTFAGVVGGGIIGVLAVLLLHYVDATFKNAYEARRLSGRRVLGAIPRTDIMMAPVESVPPEEPPEEGFAPDATEAPPPDLDQIAGEEVADDGDRPKGEEEDEG